MEVILIHYGEIALKGAKREFFEQVLIENIAASLEIEKDRIKQYKGQLVVEDVPQQLDKTLERLSRVFGITWFTPAFFCENDLEVIKAAAVEIAKPQLDPSQSFAIRGHRSIKTLPYDTPAINRQVGFVVGQASGASVDLENPDLCIYVTSSTEGTYIHTQRLDGPGGLPVGTSGRVLALLSGGFDSIAAAYMLARRGAQVDLLHVHAFPDSTPILESKISTITQGLADFTRSQNLFFASYTPFEFKVLDLDWRLRRYETVAFRRMMVRVTERLARAHGYQALVMGDCLGQVASQTLENLVAVDSAVEIPIFRPLIGMDKVEIINLVREMGLYDAATEEYKDCCSLLSPEPIKAAYMELVDKLERQIDMETVVTEICEQIERVAVSQLAL